MKKTAVKISTVAIVDSEAMNDFLADKQAAKAYLKRVSSILESELQKHLEAKSISVEMTDSEIEVFEGTPQEECQCDSCVARREVEARVEEAVNELFDEEAFAEVIRNILTKVTEEKDEEEFEVVDKSIN